MTTAKSKAIFIFQGGGALGAYEAGVYEALVEHLNLKTETEKDTLAVVAGTSIGAINASLIAKNYSDPDRGVAVLKRFWTKELATPSWPEQLGTLYGPVISRWFDEWQRWSAVWTSLLSGDPGLFDEWQRWSAVWTSLLWGDSHLYTPNLVNPIPWVFRAPFFWGNETYFYDTRVMEQTLNLNHYFGRYKQQKVDPRLIVTAVNIADGESHLFDSGGKEITAADVVACCSLPPMFPAKEIGGSYYWDGGLWSNTPLREVLNALQQSGAQIKDKYHVYIIDTFPKEGCVPQNNWQVFGRMSEITYADKTEYDRKVIEMVNEYIDLVRKLKEPATGLPQNIVTTIASMNLKYYQEIFDEKRVHVDVTIIPRSPFPDKKAESISREIDFSPTRIQELWRQGCEKAWAQLGSPQRSSPCH